MFARALAIGVLSLCCLAARADQGGWEASVELLPVGESGTTLPEVLVPKQSVTMKVVVWMPKDINWYPQYPQWDMPGATLLPLMMLSPSIEREQQGFMQRGATQNYLVTPLAEGELQLKPGAIAVSPDRSDSPVLPFQPIEIDVALPDGASSIESFLPATKLALTQHFFLLGRDGQQDEVAAEKLAQIQLGSGQMLERRIVIEALGIQGNQIPALQVDAAAIQHEAEVADLNNYGEFSGGKRTEHWFYAPGASSMIELRPVSVRWYDIGRHAFKTGKLDGARIQAVAVRQTDSRLQLPWWERLLEHKSAAVIGLLLFAIVVFVGCRYGRKIALGTKRQINQWRSHLNNSERSQFINACMQISLRGLGNQRAYHAFQKWLLRTGSNGRLNQCSAIQSWYRSKYAIHPTEPPGRWPVLGELLQLRAEIKRRVPGGGSRSHDLPELE